MRPDPIQIDRALPEEICEHREWAEFLSVKVGHDSLQPASFHVGAKFIYNSIEMIKDRGIELEYVQLGQYHHVTRYGGKIKIAIT